MYLMPELPEVEILRRSLLPHVEGRKIESMETRRRELRFPLPKELAKRLGGARIKGIDRKGKYLLFNTDRNDVLLTHLGMSGTMRMLRPGANIEPPHSHVFFVFEDGARLVYADPRRFGFMDLFPLERIDENPYLSKLGRDPLRDDIDADFLQSRLLGSRRSIKNALMDQRLIAGLGNIYCCEALFRSGISPRRLSCDVAGKRSKPSERVGRLLDAIGATLQDALDAGGSSIRDYLDAEGESGYFQHAFRVYDRLGDSCPRRGCNGVIRRIVQSGRSSFYCPRCQR